MKKRSDRPLTAMAPMVGTWSMESPQYPDFRGRATIGWIEDGAYLLVRDDVEAGDFPSGTWLFGADDSTRRWVALYHDSRGVHRLYDSSFTRGVWKIWREAPEFDQRFTGTIERGRTISGRWESRTGGARWKKDFDLVYRRIGRTEGRG